MYDATHIKVLKGLEAVRKRPQMYIGDTGDGSGLHNMVYEVVDNAINEVRAGFASEVRVTLNADGSATVRDDGRGIPTGIDPEKGKSTAEAVMTEWSGHSFFQSWETFSNAGDLHGVGVHVVNALSTCLELRIWRNGHEHLLRFRNGTAEAPLRAVGPANGRHGTEVTFWPSPDVFRKVTELDYGTLERRLHELTFLNPGLRVILKDDRPGTMLYSEGVVDLVRYLDRGKTGLLPAPIAIAGIEQGIVVDAAFWWNDTLHEQVLCFTNCIPQPRGGTHLAGFRAAFARVIAAFAIGRGMADSEHIAAAARRGLTAILSVKVRDPKFASMARDRLVSWDVAAAVDSIVADRLAAWLEVRPGQARVILADKAAATRGISPFAPRPSSSACTSLDEAPQDPYEPFDEPPPLAS